MSDKQEMPESVQVIQSYFNGIYYCSIVVGDGGVKYIRTDLCAPSDEIDGLDAIDWNSIEIILGFMRAGHDCCAKLTNWAADNKARYNQRRKA